MLRMEKKTREVEYESITLRFALQLSSINYYILLLFCAPAAFQELGVQELRVAAEEFILVTVVVFPKASHDWIYKLDMKLTSVLSHI